MNMLPLSDENLEQTSGYGLYIRRLGLRELGPYTCQAYNGLGPADSSTTLLKVLGPIDRSSISRADQKFLTYVQEAPTYYQPDPYQERLVTKEYSSLPNKRTSRIRNKRTGWNFNKK